jgi:hypothetical protein
VTDYGVRQSPYLNGTADIVRDFVAACLRGGVSPCLYFIPPMDTYESNVKVIELSRCKMTLPRSLLRFTKTQSPQRARGIAPLAGWCTQLVDVDNVWKLTTVWHPPHASPPTTDSLIRMCPFQPPQNAPPRTAPPRTTTTSTTADVQHDSPEVYLERQLQMLRELLTRYGQIDRLWIDYYAMACGQYGSNCPAGSFGHGAASAG